MSLVSGVMTAADFMSPPQLIAHAQRLEALGYDSMWITDIFGPTSACGRGAGSQRPTGAAPAATDLWTPT